MHFLNKLKILFYSLLGGLYKVLVDIKFFNIPILKDGEDLIVSLTSYGRRVSTCVVYYTIVSILRQKVKPSKIILWLADDEWNDNTIPKKLLLLKNKGVEIKYCKDIKSYKKLIPTLELYPKSNIMTIDDDIIYNSDTIKKILEVHYKEPKSIICMCSSKPILIDGIPQQYHKWSGYSCLTRNQLLFPIGYGGIFYPEGSLNKEVLKESQYMNLCPCADDIWFWFCGLLNGTEKINIKKSHLDYSFDALYQYFHKGSALTHSNRFEHENDVQFRNLFNSYNVRLTESGSLENR